ncbi:unnamed protein product [Thelazia callipaeda]|uniref:Chondroitin proteoglycan 4 domain-containing protein n=1 Tax=Thelazia callipaeda TaxID=103827 RepID=A0A158RCF3_THECL|nr:unnamed protein product [Thelazia callipaeda]
MTRIVGSTDNWAMDLTAPLQRILRDLPTNSRHRFKTFTQRMDSVCRVNLEFKDCIKRCGEQSTGHILLKDEFLSFVMPCWSEHGDDIAILCGSQAALVQRTVSSLIDSGIYAINEHLDDLCRSVGMYDKCYAKQANKLCGSKMYEFITNLNGRSFQFQLNILGINRALMELLLESGMAKEFPNSCKLMNRVSEFASIHHNWQYERGNAQRRDIFVSRSSRCSCNCSSIYSCYRCYFCFNAKIFLFIVIVINNQYFSSDIYI